MRGSTSLALALFLLVLNDSPSRPLEASPGAPAPGPGATPTEAPLRTPYVEREEVRFVIFDVRVETHVKGGWSPARGLARDRFRLFVGGRETPLDHFEDLCASPEPGVAPPPAPADGASSEAARAEEKKVPSMIRYILYFDQEHLSFFARDSAFRAAIEWAAREAHPMDEVMIVTGGNSLQIVRPMLPAARHLREDIEAARGAFGETDLYASGEDGRVKEVDDLLKSRNFPEAKAVATVYSEEAAMRTRKSLERLGDLMAVFQKVEGPKKLLFFADTLREVPGRVYIVPVDPSDVYSGLKRVAESANESDVEIYPVFAAGLQNEKSADGALTMLASETGGRLVERTNRLGVAFEKVSEDASCFYRLGFHLRPQYNGISQRIEVRLAGFERGFRLRHRRSVDDPTRGEMETTQLRAAFLDPESSREFPVSLRVLPLYDDARGSRLLVEIGVPLDGLLALPARGGLSRERQVRVQIGARIVPVRARVPGGSAVGERGVWSDVDVSRKSFSFAGQAVLTLRSSREGERAPDEIVRVAGIDVPPGNYRIVAVVQDQQARSIATALADINLRAAGGRLGPIGLASADPRRRIIEGGGETESVQSTSGFPTGVLPRAETTIESGRDAHLFYGLCASEPPVPSPGDGDLHRSLTCEGQETPLLLPPRRIPEREEGSPCSLLVDRIPASLLPLGTCRFDVRLDRPGVPAEHQSFDFSVVPRVD